MESNPLHRHTEEHSAAARLRSEEPFPPGPEGPGLQGRSQVNPAVPTWAGVAASAALVVLTVAVAWHERLRLARDITLAAVRAAVQLAAVGALLLLVFRHTGLAGAIGCLALMVLIATQARVVIPVGGMVVSGAMQATTPTASIRSPHSPPVAAPGRRLMAQRPVLL